MADSQQYISNFSSANTHNPISTIRQSGFLIGEPVAYTTNPTMPKQFQQFSPSRNDVSVSRSQRILGSPSLIGSESNSRVIVRSPPPAFYSTTSPTNQPSSLLFNPPPLTQNLVPPSPSDSRLNMPINRNQSQSIYYSKPNPSSMNLSQNLVQTRILTPEKQINYQSQSNGQKLVPKQQVDRCRQSTKLWQQKYSQLSSKFQDKEIAREPSYFSSNSKGIDDLRRQNLELKQRVREMEANQERMVQKWGQKICQMIKKSKQATLKECMLLTDRYRLETKMSNKVSNSRSNY